MAHAHCQGAPMKLAAFDSGVGGLSALAPLFHAIPHLEVTYLGDLAHLPYGIKSPERVRDLTVRNIQQLLEREAALGREPECVLIACNTASAHALERVRPLCEKRGIPALGVLEPSCALALQRNAPRTVILATASTVKSRAYETSLRKMGYSHTIVHQACPLFVSLVEDSLLDGVAVDAILGRYLDSLQFTPADSIILGCTHYPFLLPALKKKYPNLHWIQAGEALLKLPLFATSGKPLPVLKNSSLRLLFTDSTAPLEFIQRLLKALGLEDLPFSTETVDPID